MMLDEQALRRDTFQPGVLIRLQDGQSWQFPRPMIRWRQTYRDDIPGSGPRTSLGAEFDAAVKAMAAVEDSADPMGVLFGLGEALLRANYELTPADLESLLIYDPSDEANVEAWKEIASVASGVAPRTLERWAVLTAWGQGGPGEDWALLEDVNDWIGLLVQGGGRPVPASKWVTDLIDEAQAEMNEAAGPC